MNSIVGFAVGKVSKRGEKISRDGKKPFAACGIKLTREWQGKEFYDTVKLITYRDVDDIVPRLTVGTWVSVNGDVGIEKWEYNGKPCACNKIVGTISVLGAGSGSAGQPYQPRNQGEEPEKDGLPF